MFYFCVAVIEKEYLIVGLALFAHHGGTYLAHTYTMAPALSVKDKAVALLLDIKGRTQEMSLTESTTYLKLLAYRECLLGTYYLKFPDTAALASLHRDEVGDGAEIVLKLTVDKLRELLLGILNSPTIEIYRLLIIVIQHLREDILVAGVTIRVMEGYQIRLRGVLPAVLELLGLTSTTFREPCIADLVAIGKDLSASLADGLFHGRTRLFGDALIALTVVIGTDIKDGMVFTVVPTDKFIVLLDKREECPSAIVELLTFLHLRQKPGTGYYGMSLKELLRSRCRHLAGDDTREVTLYGEFVDGNDLVCLYHQSEGS